MTTFDLAKYNERFEEIQQIDVELETTYRRLYDNYPYAALSGVYLSMLRGFLSSADEYTYNFNIGILRDIIKSNHMEYYKNVANDKYAKP